MDILYFAFGFFTAVGLFMTFILATRDEDSKGADDSFRVLYFKDDGKSKEFPQSMKVTKYKKEIRGAMAKDMYHWLTGKDEPDEEE